jgi:hypothetical protein
LLSDNGQGEKLLHPELNRRYDADGADAKANDAAVKKFAAARSKL